MYTGMTRTVKELLRVMLKHQYLFKYGLCYWALSLWDNKLITTTELEKLKIYIDKNKPFKIKIFPWFGDYYWKKGDIKPRIKWINKHRNKL
jgi:hypothetical protein